MYSTIFGILGSSGIKPISPCDLKEGDTFYALLGENLGIMTKHTTIEERKVKEITVWTEHWTIPDYLGGDEDCKECRLVYSYVDETGFEDTVVIPKVPNTWIIFKTKKEAAQYVIDHLDKEEDNLREDLEDIGRLKEKFAKLL